MGLTGQHAMTTATPTDELADFVRWAREMVGELAAGGSSGYDAGSGAAIASGPIEVGSPEFTELMASLRTAGPVLHSRPTQHVRSVHDVAQRLLPAYAVEGGRFHLGGCLLEDRPVVRLTFHSPQRRADDPQPPTHLVQVFVDASGELIADSLRAELGLDGLEPFGENPPRIAQAEAERLIAQAEHAVQAQSEAVLLPGGAASARIAATLVWCKYAVGKLVGSRGDWSAEFPFEGWADRLQPEPLECPLTGAQTFRFAATDDDLVAAAEEIAVCSESGRRVLRSEFVTCTHTGRQALPEFITECPVMGVPVLTTALVECPVTQLRVSPAAIDHGKCRAIEQLQPVDKHSANESSRLLAEFLLKHPELQSWKRWRMFVGATIGIAEGAGLIMRRLIMRRLIVFDRATLTVLHEAERRALSSEWKPVA